MNFITDGNAKIKTTCDRCGANAPELIKYETKGATYKGLCSNCYEKEKAKWLESNKIKLNKHSIIVNDIMFDFKGEVIADDFDNIIGFNLKDIEDSLFRLESNSSDSVVIERKGNTKFVTFKCTNKLGHVIESKINADVDPRVNLVIKRTKSGKTTFANDNDTIITTRFTQTQLRALYQYSLMYKNKVWRGLI